jgi:N-acyl-D-amino-acid deacylase
MFHRVLLLLTATTLPVVAVIAQMHSEFDVLIKSGTVYDGSGGEGRPADVAIKGDRIAGVGDFKTAKAKTIIDAGGLAVAPGLGVRKARFVRE